MAACCGVPRCSCSVIAGPGVTVDGNGSAAAPYVITVDSTPTPTPIQAGDTATVDTTVSGTGVDGDPYIVSADVILDPTPPGGGDNLLQEGPDGLFVECADVRTCFTGGDGIAYDEATGEIAAQLSGDAGNTTVFGTDGGIYTPAAATELDAMDSPTVDVTVTGTGAAGDPYQVGAAVILDPAPPGGGSNLLEAGPDGLYVECADVRTCFTGGDGIDYDPATGEIAAQLSGDAGNTVVFGGDGGLFVPAGASGTVVEGGDSPTASNTVTGTGAAGDPYVVTTDVVLDPAPPGGGSNLLEAGPDGLYVECADVRTCFSAGDGIDYDPATGEIAAQLSADAGNSTVFGTDGGIYTPAGGTALQGADTNTVDITVSGTGAAGDPYSVEADVIVAPDPNGLEATPTGLLVAPSADAGNQLEFGADGRLFVPPDDPLEIGCGLQGDGTAATPLAAFPIAGEQLWTDDWDCDPVANSTLKCDPSSGALWAPPEHTSAAVTVQQNHPLGTPTVAVTTGFVIVDNSAFAEGAYAADSLTTCRGMSFNTTFQGHVQLSWPANAQFELGYAIQINGGALAVRVLHGVYASGPARQERYSFGVSQAAVLAPHTGHVVRVYPAVRVIAGSVTFQQWITDTNLIAVTR
ncbi:hypothetical protein ACFPN0_15280 [Kitasatospora cinereorecta]